VRCVCESDGVKGANRVDGVMKLVKWDKHGWVLYLYGTDGRRNTFTPVRYCPVCGKELR